MLLYLVSSSTHAGLTRVSIIQDHLAIAGLHPCLTNRLQAKLNPAARLQLRQDEGALIDPQGHLLCDVVCSVEVEGGEEEEGELLRAVPGQRYAAAVPWRHLKVFGNVWVWWKKNSKHNIFQLPLTGLDKTRLQGWWEPRDWTPIIKLWAFHLDPNGSACVSLPTSTWC